MQSSKIIISSLLILSALGSAFIPNLLLLSNNSQANSPQALDYSFIYTNNSLDLQVQSSIPSYLYVKIDFSNKTVINTTSSLAQDQIFKFFYFNKSFIVSAGLFTDTKSKSDLTFFVTNRTIFQPFPFKITHKIIQFLNKTSVTLSSSTQLNLQSSSIDNNHIIQFNGKNNSYYIYNYSTESESNSLYLKDIYNRSLSTVLTFPSLSNQINNNSSTSLDFKYNYQIQNITSIVFYINATQISSAQITLNSTRDFRTLYSTSLSQFHEFTCSNLLFTTYQISLTVLTSTKSLSKNIGISINDTTEPIITKYTISTGLTTIKTNFTFSKEVKIDYYLTYQNGTISLTKGNSYLIEQTKLFSVPIGKYNLTLGLTDHVNHHKQYNFYFIKTKQLDINSYLSFTTNQSVITNQDKGVELYPIVVFNGSRVFLKDSMLINISSNSLLLQHSQISLANSSLLLLNSEVLSLFSTSILTISAYLPFYHLQFEKQIQLVIPVNLQTVSPYISLQSYVSNVSVNDVISLHLTSNGFSHSTTAYIDIYSPDLQYSLLYTSAQISNGQLTKDFFLTIPQIPFKTLNLTAKIFFDSVYYPTKSYLELVISNGVDSSLPITNYYSLYNSSQSMILKVNSTKPVQLELFYGLNTSYLTSQIVNSNYQSEFIVNISSILYQNSYNYYYFKLHDSNGLESTYDNNSNYFYVYIPKIDYLAPYNITTVSLSANGTLSFKTNEEVTVQVKCMDTSGMVGNYQCGQENVFNTKFSILLSFPLSGLTYTIYQLILTDKAGNTKNLSLNFSFST